MTRSTEDVNFEEVTDHVARKRLQAAVIELPKPDKVSTGSNGQQELLDPTSSGSVRWSSMRTPVSPILLIVCLD